MLNNPSDEQLEIIKNVKDYNLIIEAMAGSGKTTTSLHITKNYENLNILLLTYNAKLKMETRQKRDLLGLVNLEVHSYHSFCVKYYNPKSYRDKEILNILKNNTKCKKFFHYDLIILDETQDMTEIYFNLFHKIVKDNNDKPKICLFGDRHQCIFQFKDADSRFLLFAEYLFNINNFEWKKLSLKTSFRITNQIANCLNHVCFKENKIKAIKDNVKPEYYIIDSYSIKIVELVLSFLNQGYKEDQIFILSNSVKNPRTPIRSLANHLTKRGINLYVSNNKDEIKDDDLIKNKLVLTTFHSVKGLERDIVIIFNFDESFYTYTKTEITDKIPNVYYVAMTRAKEKLIVIHDNKFNYMPFLDKDKIKDYFQVKIIDSLISQSPKMNPKNSFSVSELLEYIPSSIIDKIMNFIKITEIDIETNYNIIKLDYKSKQENTFEFVSDITGTAIPLFYEYYVNKKIGIYDEVKKIFHSTFKKNDFIFDISNISESLKLANYYLSSISGYNYKHKQIKKYDWLNKEIILDCIDRLQNLNFVNPKFEIETFKMIENYLIKGRIDIIDNEKIFELKCTSETLDEHFIQLAIYGFLNDNFNNLYLYNIFLNKMYRISIDNDFDKNVIISLIDLKIKYGNTITNEEFIEKYKNYS